MGISNEIQPYLDSNGLVSFSTTEGSTNGVMYSGEYLYLRWKTEPTGPANLDYWRFILSTCFMERGLLMRSPKNEGGQEGPDDYLGLFMANKVLGAVSPDARDFSAEVMEYGLRHRGVFNNETLNKFSWAAFLWRQPQLIAACHATMRTFPRYKKALYWLLTRPFYLVAAITLAVSCYNKPINDSDSRRLAWILGEVTSDKSLFCRLGYFLWKRRLFKDYGEGGMCVVSRIYYGPNHPFARHHLTKQGYK